MTEVWHVWQDIVEWPIDRNLGFHLDYVLSDLLLTTADKRGHAGDVRALVKWSKLWTGTCDRLVFSTVKVRRW